MTTEILLKQHHTPNGFSDLFALAFTKSARFFADTFLPAATVIARLS